MEKIEVTNSKFLDYIYSRAEELKSTYAKVLTTNHVFAAMLEYVKNALEEKDFGKYGDEAEEKAICDIISEVVLVESIPKFIVFLCSLKYNCVDEVNLRNVKYSALRESESAGKENISADTVLKYIIKFKTEKIKNILESKNKAAQDADSNDEKKTQEEEVPFKIEDLTDEIINADAKEKQEENTLTPKEKISKVTEKANLMQKELSNVIFGQENAINILAAGYFQSELRDITDKNSKKPKATFLFAGPPGVGKTFLAEQAAEFLKLPFIRFDMSEYADRDGAMELLGTNKAYRGNKEGALTGFVEKHPRCVLLFDEIEKANISVIHLFLQVLDAGRLRDLNSGKEVDFSQTVIIFTTNAGRKLYEGSLTPNLSGISRKAILKALETDVDPKTGLGSFPAAICSRFATGNVVMFNHMEAHSLRKIVENEISKNVKCLEEETGIKCDISDDIYSCVLFSEGGHADARTVKSRANSFLGTELYELFRLVSDKECDVNIKNIENISINVELPEGEQVARLFRDDSKGYILSFGDESTCQKLSAIVEEKGYRNKIVSSLEEAKSVMNKEDIEFILCDLHSGRRSTVARALNIEDIDSEGREIFRYVCESTDVPLYVLSDDNHKYTDQETVSLISEGARSIVDVSDGEGLDEKITDILSKLHHQNSMIDLARSNKLITYETSQTLSEDGKKAEITLFDIDLETSVEAEDSKDILSDVSKPDIKFDDIIGLESAKSELRYFVNYLKNPKAFSSKGLGVPKGVLFYGPPGTGKTMLAKAVAGEADVTFICAEGNQFLKKYVGEGEELVHNLFATARKYAPTIIFIDEIDAIAKERKGEKVWEDSIVTAFLAEMDGFKTDAKKPVFVLAATNFEVEPGGKKSLDPALLRRFDRHIYIDLPDKNGRKEYVKMIIGEKPIFDISEEEIENISIRSTGMSLAQLESVFEFSMRIAIREGKEKVDDEIFEEAFESFNYGEEKKWDITELRKTAYHEAGHAFLCWHSGEVPAYVTIVARGNHGGYMLHGDTENRGSYTKEMLVNRIRTALGGRASELVFFGDKDGLTTGASGDLNTATSIAQSIVCKYGMDDGIGLAVVSENEISSGIMAQPIREAVNNILKNELEVAKTILNENKTAIEKIVEELLQKNHLSSKEIDRIFSEHSSKIN